VKRDVVLSVVAGMVLLAVLAPTAGAAPPSRAIANSNPLWTAQAVNLGHASRSAAVKARVYLAPVGGLAAVAQLATAMATPGNRQYQQFLTPVQYQQRFGPTDAIVRAVSAYLRAAGLKVTGVGAGNRYISIKGRVAAAQRAFGARIDRYRHNGQVVQAPTTALAVPASLASYVLTVSGLDTTPHMVTPASKPQVSQPAGYRNARPCSAYYGQTPASFAADGTTPLPKFDGATLPYAVCGYTGTQLRSAYEGSTTLDGAGVTVAITDAYASPSIASDAATYAYRNGDRAYVPGQLSQTVPQHYTHEGVCGANGWWGEETLDVEAVHAMAQGANIHYYAAASCFDPDFLDTLGQVVDDGAAQIVTNSWDDYEATTSPDVVAAYQAIFMQGAVEGMSFMFSSGDDGDELASTGTVQVDYPASDPYVTAVGGTAIAVGSAGSRLFETGWGTIRHGLSGDGTSWGDGTFYYGSGGGSSALFAKPSYQAGLPGDARLVPDVAMDGDPTTGMLVGETQRFPKGGVKYDEYRIGGTSLASPLFAGMTALALQNAGGGGAGLLNPTIYAKASAFNDISGNPPDAGNVRVDYVNDVDLTQGVVYSLRTFSEDSSLATGQGWDDVTGLGVPNSGWFSAF
jgi:subtilase family serine protease